MDAPLGSPLGKLRPCSPAELARDAPNGTAAASEALRPWQAGKLSFAAVEQKNFGQKKRAQRQRTTPDHSGPFRTRAVSRWNPCLANQEALRVDNGALCYSCVGLTECSRSSRRQSTSASHTEEGAVRHFKMADSEEMRVEDGGYEDQGEAISGKRNSRLLRSLPYQNDVVQPVELRIRRLFVAPALREAIGDSSPRVDHREHKDDPEADHVPP
eukprot:scaffold1712_cov261-Pinguiococcus_pyrenoidosus.AAC.12